MPHPLLAACPVVIEIDVGWSDMDSFDHVSNLVYFRYFQDARLVGRGTERGHDTCPAWQDDLPLLEGWVGRGQAEAHASVRRGTPMPMKREGRFLQETGLCCQPVYGRGAGWPCCYFGACGRGGAVGATLSSAGRAIIAGCRAADGSLLLRYCL